MDAEALKESCRQGVDNAGFSTVIKGRLLDGWVGYCDGTVGNTSVVTDG